MRTKLKSQIWLLFVLFPFISLIAQQSQTGSFEINDKGIQGLSLQWTPAMITTHPVEIEGVTWQYIRLGGLTHTKEVGKPALPCRHEMIAIPQGADVQISVKNATWIDIPSDYPVHPALQPATDTYGATEPEFEFDEQFYSTDQFYPQNILGVGDIQYLREISFGIYTFFPVQYNPYRKLLRIYTSIEAEIYFSGGTHFVDPGMHSYHFLEMVPRYFLNSMGISSEIAAKGTNGISSHSSTPNYILITHNNYMPAALRLAQWKQQMGHRVEVIDGTGMTSANIKTEVHNRYNGWTPKPDFLLIIGDHPDIPGEVITGSYGTFATDLYYVCTGPGNDFVADFAVGRISVSTLAEANDVVTKIIQYETNPPSDSSFYNSSVHAAYFQHASNGYAERRFAQTSEELRDYMTNIQGYDVTRVFVTGSSVNPTNWNNGLYSAGEPIPLYLRKPTFPWNGNATNINTAINNGVFYVMHRDHGLETGWGDPAYSNSNVSALNNGIKTPIVFTINCLTGKYYYGECFSERFLRKYPGGAVGVFGHAEVSLSGYNDALAFGVFDAIWANPGCIPVFTGSGGIKNPNVSSHPPILTMGDVRNHSLIRMTQTWGTHQYTNELFHYFGDPSMRIYTRKPLQITALHPGTIQCGIDTSLIVSSNSPTGIVTLVVDSELIAICQLVNNTATLTFPQLSGTFAILTITDTNAVAYVDTIIITGGCPKSAFTHSANNYCTAESITFTSTSTGNITNYLWNFGLGASPATATGQGPHTINYVFGGQKNISLVVSGVASHTSSTSILIDSICTYAVPANGSDVIANCSGLLMDDGGDLNYSNSSDGTITISPSGASAINLLFSSFSFENSADYLRIYNGPNTSSPLIGSYTGNTLPGVNGMLSSTTGSITIRQLTNANNSFPGFKLSFQCSYPNSPPQANFILTDSNHCTGVFEFTDLTFNGPSSWTWHFGDGTTSTQQNPQHQYSQNGTYNVSLVTVNQFGTDSVVKYGIVNVNMPVTPVAADVIRCKSGKVTLQATGNANINWYDQPTGGTPIATGPVFVTPALNQSTTYYVQSELPAPLKYAGKPDNNGDGDFLAYEHYLVFNAMATFRINSVKVFAQSGGNRTIQLRNSSGTTLKTVTLFVPAGESRVTINFDVPVANNLRLVCAGTPNLYRNNSGLSYPYDIPGLLSIHSTSATSNPTGYYYYFYDWEVAEEPCTSSRTQVNAIISDSLLPVSQFSYTINTNQVQFANNSLHADSYLWNLGDGATSTLQHPFYVYQTPGQYMVTLQVQNECGSDLSTQTIGITTGIDDKTGESAFRYYPNPAVGKLIVEYASMNNDPVLITFTDPAGRLVSSMKHSSNFGINKHELDISSLIPGIWLMNISTSGFNKTVKLIVAPR